MPKRTVTMTSERAKRRIARILEVLAGGMLSATDIAAKVHCDRSMVSSYLQHLMDEPRQVRIGDYEVVNGCKRPLYALGAEPDEPMTRQKNAERWAKVKADPEKYKASLESRRDSHRRKRAAVPPELRQRDRRTYDPPLAVQVESLVLSMPGYTTPQIAVKLDANERAVALVVGKLRAEGKLQRAEHGKSKKFRWESPSNPLPAPVVDKPQGIFAALGL